MNTNPYNSIFEYITSQEASYKLPIQLPGNWSWSMKQHIETSYLYNNSQLLTGKNDFKPVKNITRPILNLQHRTEDIELKDVQIYVDDADKYHLSFLVKKYHDDVFAVENDIDTFFDDLNVSRIDYGGGLSKHLNKPCPEVVPLQSIVFCDQTDILSGPIGIKHFYSPDQLMEMEKVGWGNESNGASATLEQVITLSRESKREGQNDTMSDTPGRYIEVYEVHGNFPKRFLDPADTSGLFSSQIHIVCFYQKSDSSKGNITLFRAEEKESPFKLIKRDPVYGRALGFGGAEELFEAQVWVNYDMIRMQDMLDAASKTILSSTDPTVATKGKVRDMDNLEIVDLAPGTELRQVDTFPRNLKLFENNMLMLETHAKEMGAAQDPLQGKEPVAGTPFASLNAQIQQGLGLHEYRRGQYAKHLEEIYTDWVIPHIEKQIVKGAKFLSELSLDELQYVTECIVRTESNKRIKEMVLAGLTPTPDEAEVFKQLVRDELKKKGNKYFIEILKGEFKDASLAVKVSVAGKSKNLSLMADKVSNIFKFAFSNPQGFGQVLQIPGMAKAFNELLEYSGMSPVDFTGIEDMAISQPPQQAQPAPVEAPQPQYA